MKKIICIILMFCTFNVWCQEIDFSNLENILDQQTSDLMALELQWQLLESQSKQLATNNKELNNALDSCKVIINTLQDNLAEAREHLGNAGVDILAMADLNTQLFNDAKELLSYCARLERQNKLSPVGTFLIGGTWAVGTGLIITGSNNNLQNVNNIWYGVGTIGIGTLVYVLGHWVFQLF